MSFNEYYNLEWPPTSKNHLLVAVIIFKFVASITNSRRNRNNISFSCSYRLVLAFLFSCYYCVCLFVWMSFSFLSCHCVCLHNDISFHKFRIPNRHWWFSNSFVILCFHLLAFMYLERFPFLLFSFSLIFYLVFDTCLCVATCQFWFWKKVNITVCLHEENLHWIDEIIL